MLTCLWHVVQILFRHKWRKLDTASLYISFIDGYSCLGYWNEFLSSVFRVLDWSFLQLHFCGNVCNWISKLIWLQMDWFLFFFCWNMPRFVDFMSACTKICENCSNRFSFLTTSNLFDSLRGFLVCSLNVPVFFSQRIL